MLYIKYFLNKYSLYDIFPKLLKYVKLKLSKLRVKIFWIIGFWYFLIDFPNLQENY